MRKMVYVICIMLFICVYLPVYINAAAEEYPLTDLLTESQNAGGLVPELDPSRLPDDVPSIEGKPILVLLQLYNSCDFTQYSLEELYDQCSFIEYLVIDKTMTVLTDRDSEPNGPYQAMAVTNYHTYKGVPTFISDVLDSGSCGVFLGEEYNIQNVICLRGFEAVFVYYITDGGTFIRVYEEYSGEKPCVAEFSLQDFHMIFKMYLDFYDADRYSNKDHPSGSHPCAGGHFFPHYIQNPGSWHKQYCYIDTNGLDENVAFYTVSCVCLIAVVAAVTVIYWYIRDKKKRDIEALNAWIQGQSQVNEST